MKSRPMQIDPPHMAPKPWATAAELAFLQSKMPRYIKLQGEGKLHLFWPSLHEAWFREFPEEPRLGLPTPTPTPGAGGDAVPLTATQLADLGTAIMARKGRLDNWFRNQRAKMLKVGSVVTPSVSSDSSLAGVLFAPGGPKRHRRHQAIEVYQKQHPERIRDALKAAGYHQLNEENTSAGTDLDEAGQTARIKAAKALRMRMRTRLVKEMWDEGERTPAEYQVAINELDAVMVKVHGAVDSMAGWKGFTVVGGPHPKFGGSMSVKITCFGVSSGGNNFRQSHPTWEDSVARPFQDWLKRVYPTDVRKARALVEKMGTPTDAAAPEDAAEAEEPEEEAPAQTAKPKKPKRIRRKSAPKNTSAPTSPVLPAEAGAASAAPAPDSDAPVPDCAPPTPTPSPAGDISQLHAAPLDTPTSSTQPLERSLYEQVVVWEAMVGPYDAGASGNFHRDGSGYSPSVGDMSDMDGMDGDMGGDTGGDMGGGLGDTGSDTGGDMGGGLGDIGMEDMDSSMGGMGGEMTNLGGWHDEASATPSWATNTVSTPAALSSAYPRSGLFLAFEKAAYVAPGAPPFPSTTTDTTDTASSAASSTALPQFAFAPTATATASSAWGTTVTAMSSPADAAHVALSTPPLPSTTTHTTFSAASSTVPPRVALGTAVTSMSSLADAAQSFPADAAHVAPSTLPLTSVTTHTTSSIGPLPITTAIAATSAPSAPPQSRPMARWPPASFSASPKPPRKAAGKKPAAKAQAQKKSEKGVDVDAGAGSNTTLGDAVPAPLVYTMTNNNRRINVEADQRIAKRKAAEKKQKMLLHNPDGPTPLVVLPRARRARAQADGTEVKLPKRHTRKELEILRLEAVMRARGVAAQAEHDAAAAKTGTKRKAVDVGTNGAVKKRKV
ncbi:hypothetical protein C8J57DRAFT_1592874 [Mycena rebaudengoi]|nr:hypothetical protein C8J57DRAFT_1592874 [Mycena rebaudengoi]